MLTPKANRITDPRLLAALPDPRVAAIEEAVRRCNASGHRREQLIAGRYVWPRHVVALYDELLMGGATTEQILAVGDSLRDAAVRTAYDGNAAPRESLGEGLVLEADAECEANKATALLVDAPNCPTRRQRLLQAATLHIARLDFVRRILLGGQRRSA